MRTLCAALTLTASSASTLPGLDAPHEARVRRVRRCPAWTLPTSPLRSPRGARATCPTVPGLDAPHEARVDVSDGARPGRSPTRPPALTTRRASTCPTVPGLDARHEAPAL